MKELFDMIGGVFKALWEMPWFFFVFFLLLAIAAIASKFEKK